MIPSDRTNTEYRYKPTKHEREMEMLRAYTQFLLTDRAAAQECLVASGVFVRRPDGDIEVAEPYKELFVDMRKP